MPPMAKIADLLAQGRTLSFEFSAPRDPEGEQRLMRTLGRLAALKPAFMSVTYGAGGSSRGPTPEVVRHILGLGVTGMPHLTCVSHTREEIRGLLDAYAEMGVQNLLALHGDLPEGTTEMPAGHFTRAVDLVALARLRTDWSIGVAAHPEGHPKASSPADDIEHHAQKLAAADFAITQFFFRAEYYERFVATMVARGVRTPVIAGIMPPTNIEGIGRMAALNGTEYPREILARLEAAGDDVDARREIATEEATRLGEQLLAAGTPGLHIYTMNFSEPARTIARNLGLA
ncbi:MAG: 5,10-methylenetetrahydrofolate reductase [Dehalococcoidia bacterium]|nr:MAG: 5,10-methylenetetrahydrofolate reductase [Dehalococcoidia bacterium]